MKAEPPWINTNDVRNAEIKTEAAARLQFNSINYGNTSTYIRSKIHQHKP